jgi:hypothetical protein
MCLGCLEKQLESIEEYGERVEEYLATITCECCKSYPNFLMGMNNYLKMLTLTKIKRRGQVCPNSILASKGIEDLVKKKVQENLTRALEGIDDIKCDITDDQYLTKMNDLKDLNDCLTNIEEADHR